MWSTTTAPNNASPTKPQDGVDSGNSYQLDQSQGVRSLPRRPRRGTNEAVGRPGRASPITRAGDRRRQVRTASVLAGRVTCVPHRTVDHGPERTTTGTVTPPTSWPSRALAA